MMTMDELLFESISHTPDRRAYLPLLREADPADKQINSYLNLGEMFVARIDLRAVGTIIVVPVSLGTGEIKNLAVDADYRGQGLGRKLIEYAITHTRHHYTRLMVGTSESGVGFYQSCGFGYSHRAPNFFLKHYPQPVFDGDQQCVDMIYLQRRL